MGPWDVLIWSAYLSAWGQLATFFTILFQYKSAYYENDKTIYFKALLKEFPDIYTNLIIKNESDKS